MENNAIISLSGGLDSTMLLMKLLSEGRTVKAYSFDYGQKHDIELKKVRKNIKFLQKEGWPVEHQVINVRDCFSDSASSLHKGGDEIPKGDYSVENQSSTVIENRNIIFSAIIYGKALAWSKKAGQDVDITLGIHAGDHCFTKDTKILTPEGYKTIETLQVGDEIYSFDGNNTYIDKCLDVIKKGTNDKIYKINTSTGSIRLTGEHKVYVIELGNFSNKGGFDKIYSSKSVKDLSTNDILISSAHLPNKNNDTDNDNIKIHITPIIKTWLNQFGNTYDVIEEENHTYIHLNKNNRNTYKYDSYMDAKSLLSIMAWYITEGWSSSEWKKNPKASKFGSCFSQSAYKNLVNCISIEEDLKKLNIPISITHDKFTINNIPIESTYQFNSVISVLMHTCGDKSSEKHIPQWIMEFLKNNQSYIKDFIYTMICGDGNQNKISGLNTYTTNSYQLALDMSFLIKLMGMYVKVMKNKNCWILQFGNLDKKPGLVKFGDCAMTRIKSIEVEYREEEVYDISVEKNHNFFAGEFGNILISNSVYPDTTQESFEAAKHCYEISNWGSEKVHYIAPFVNITKDQVLKVGIEAMEKMFMYDKVGKKIDKNSRKKINKILKNTHSCYDPDGNGKSCGTCGTCKERLEAFEKVGMKDPIEYVE